MPSLFRRWEAGVLPGRQSGSVAWRSARGELGAPAQSEKESKEGDKLGKFDEEEAVGGLTLSKSGVHGKNHNDTTTWDDAQFLGDKIGQVRPRDGSGRAFPDSDCCDFSAARE